MKILKLLVFPLLLISLFSCNTTDDTLPILTMNPPDSLYHVLNALYVDPGATATDDVDGNITSTIFIDEQVNENLVGWYSVTYNVVDQAGNEAPKATRWVFIYNQSWNKTGYYAATEQKMYPETENYELICADQWQVREWLEKK